MAFREPSPPATGSPTPVHASPPDDRPGWFTTIGLWCYDHRRATVGLWAAVLISLVTAAAAIGPSYSGVLTFPDSESADGLTVLDEHFPALGAGGASGSIVFQAEQGVDDPAVMAAMEALFADLDAGFPNDQGVPRHPGATVVSPYSPEGQGQIARQGPLADRLAFAQVNLAADVEFSESALIGQAIIDHAPTIDGLEVLPGGTMLAPFEPPQTEFIGLAFAIVVLIVAFGSVVAMGLPIATALGGLGAGLGAVVLVSNVLTVPDFTIFLAVMIGLGVGIDYALFIVTRFREGLADGHPPRSAAAQAIGTAGRAVIFAGLTVVISMLGLLVVGLDWIAGMGIAISLTVLATMLTSVTLLPALLGFIRERVEATQWRGLIMAGAVAIALLGVGVGYLPLTFAGLGLTALVAAAGLVVPALRAAVPRPSPTPVERTFAYRWSRTIQRRPWVWLGVGTLALLTLSAPILGLQLGFSDEGNYPEGSYTREAYDLLADGFGPGFNGPFIVTVETGPDDGPEAVADLAAAIAATPGVASVSPPFPDDPSVPDAYLLNVIATTAPQDQATSDLVQTLRDDVIPAATVATALEVRVTGMAAGNVDSTAYLADRVLVFFAAVLAVSFLLLLMVFRSVLVPIKAVLMNVLSISAAYGVVVAIFQWGWAGSIVGIEPAPIEPMVPLMLFAIVFGLSMDYEVFLLSRIREAFTSSGDSAGSVAKGLASTARVISAAAAIMVVVFGSFLLEDDRITKLFGLGLALAVFLDATLVRMLLVPATMELLGARNWWMPRWLDRLLPRLDIEGSAGVGPDVESVDPDESSVLGEVAGDRVADAPVDELRHLVGASILGLPASGAEPAPGGRGRR